MRILRKYSFCFYDKRIIISCYTPRFFYVHIYSVTNREFQKAYYRFDYADLIKKVIEDIKSYNL